MKISLDFSIIAPLNKALNTITIITVFSFFASGCQSKNTDNTTSPSKQNNLATAAETAQSGNDAALADLSPSVLRPTFYKRMEGSIGTEPPTTLHLQYKDSLLQGTYTMGEEVFLLDNGKLSGDNGIMAKVYRQTNDGGLELSGYMSGYINRQGNFEGNYTPSRSKDGIMFHFKELYDAHSAALQLLPIDKKHGDCNGENPCFNLKSAYFQVRGGANNPQSRENCNTHLKNLLINQLTADNTNAQFTQIEAAVETACTEFDKQTQNMPLSWDVKGSPSVKYNGHNLLSIAFETYEYRGGAHPNHATHTLNLNLQNGQSLGIEDILNKNYSGRLSMLIEQALRQTHNIAEGVPLSEAGFTSNNIAPSKDFFLTPKGIAFHYSPYQIAPAVMGDIEVHLPYTALTELIPTNGILAEIIAQK